MTPHSEKNFNFSFLVFVSVFVCVFFFNEVHCLGPLKIMLSTFHSSISLRMSFQTIAFQAFYFIKVFGQWSSTLF